MRIADLSNLNGPLTDAILDDLIAQEVEGVIIQAIKPPQGFPGWEVGGYTAQQMHAAIGRGLKVGAYVWLWHAFQGVTLEHDLGLRVATIPDDVPLELHVWLDVEDTDAKNYALETNLDDVSVALTYLDRWATIRGVPVIPRTPYHVGVYTGMWFWNGYLANTDRFHEYALWDADYDGSASVDDGWVSYGGWAYRVLKQYQGSPLDLNVGLEDAPVPEPEPTPEPAPEPTIPVAVAAHGFDVVAVDQLTKELARKTATGRAAAPRRTEIQRITNEIAAFRAQYIGPRP